MKTRVFMKCLFLPLLLCACQKEGQPASLSSSTITSSLIQEEYAFDVYHLTLEVGDSYRIRLTKGEEEVRGAVWSSSASEVATVSSVGTIFAFTAGVTHIKATIENKSLLCEVKVNPKKMTTTEEIYFRLDVDTLTLYAGDSYPITPTLWEDGKPVEGEYEAVSSNAAIATLDPHLWQVNAISKGEATLTVTARKGTAKASATIAVKVYEK